MIVTSRAPVRIDFAGGWTDVDAFAQGTGGAVLNATIDKYVTGTLEVRDGEDTNGCLRDGISITYRSALPAGSGLGTSSALNVVWLSLVKSRIAGMEDKKMVAKLAYDLEAILGILGGKQDQYASAVGGFNFMTFRESVEVEPLALAPAVIDELEQRLVLCYTGRSRLSGNIHEKVWGAYRRGNAETVSALYSLRNLAYTMRCVLLSGRLNEFPGLLNENWECQKRLDATITNDQIEGLFAQAYKHGATGGKACGAGGGGCILFFTEGGRKDEVSAAVERMGGRTIPFRFEFDGLQVRQT